MDFLDDMENEEVESQRGVLDTGLNNLEDGDSADDFDLKDEIHILCRCWFKIF